MKLFLQQDNHPYDPARYRYGVEQMLLTLFPAERPEYPPEEGHILQGNGSYARFAVRRSAQWTRVEAEVVYQGARSLRFRRVPSAALDGGQGEYKALQHAFKLAFYRAGTDLLGQQPPWGALTGVRPVKLPTRALQRGATPAQAARELLWHYCVSPPRVKLALDCAKASLSAGAKLKPHHVSLYIGIPFCPSRCSYCSFVSADVGRSLALVEPFLDALCREIDHTAQVLTHAGLAIRTLYMGGGTPTTLSPVQLERLLAHCRARLPLDECIEYTVEAGRPDTITREKLDVLRRYGIERISVNPQTLEEPVLAAIGRRHTVAQTLQAFDLVRQTGFSCINMDLIAALPGDTVHGFARSLDGVLARRPENITLHTLARKRGASLNESPLPDGTDALHMLDTARAQLSGAGYVPYYLYRQKYMSGALENVGWTLPGQESLYNIFMMEELHSVLSVGGGGITKLIDPQTGKILRLSNPKYPHDYLAGLDKVLAQKESILAFFRAGGANIRKE